MKKRTFNDFFVSKDLRPSDETLDPVARALLESVKKVDQDALAIAIANSIDKYQEEEKLVA